jgi:hypothetical protein
MTSTTLAVYENGAPRPVQPLPFADGEAGKSEKLVSVHSSGG